MKKTILLLSFLMFNYITGYAQKTDENSAKKTDPKLTGSWEGSEKDNQIKGMEKHWIMHRFDDGTFVLLFVAINNGKVSKFTEKGTWRVEGDTFYEYHNVSKKTDVYKYKVIDDNHIKFKAQSLGVEHDNQEYEFIDTRLPGV